MENEQYEYLIDLIQETNKRLDKLEESIKEHQYPYIITVPAPVYPNPGITSPYPFYPTYPIVTYTNTTSSTNQQ